MKEIYFGICQIVFYSFIVGFYMRVQSSLIEPRRFCQTFQASHSRTTVHEKLEVRLCKVASEQQYKFILKLHAVLNGPSHHPCTDVTASPSTETGWLTQPCILLPFARCAKNLTLLPVSTMWR